MTPWISFAAVAVAATPSLTDLTATYTAASGNGSIKVEVARNGDSRVEIGTAALTFLHRDGHTYMWVARSGEPPKVIDVADLKATVRDSYAKSGTDLCTPFAQTTLGAKLVQEGTATVQGRTGDAWFRQMAAGESPARPELVISHDPDLAPIGVALAEEYRASTGMMPDCPFFRAMTEPMEAVLASGTPVALSGIELTAVDAGPIDPKRFELPAPPVSVEELRKERGLGHHD